MATTRRTPRVEAPQSRADAAVQNVHRALQHAYDAHDTATLGAETAERAAIDVTRLHGEAADVFDMARAQLRIAQHDILRAVGEEAVTVGDGLRALASLPTEIGPEITAAHHGQLAEARLAFINNLINTGDGEPAIAILPNGTSIVLPGNTVITPHASNGQPGMIIQYEDSGRQPMFLAFADVATLGNPGVVASEVIAGRRAIGESLHRSPVLNGGTVNADAKGHNEVRGALHLLGTLVPTQLDLTDYGFTEPEVAHLTQLWTGLATHDHPAGRSVTARELVTAMQVIDRRNGADYLLNALQSMGARVFDEAAKGGVAFVGYSARYLELYEALYGPQDQAGRVEAMRSAGRFALQVASTTPDTV